MGPQESASLDRRQEAVACEPKALLPVAPRDVSMGLAVMRRLNTRYGDTPRALLAVTLAASLFPDTANALALAALFAWLGQ